MIPRLILKIKDPFEVRLFQHDTLQSLEAHNRPASRPGPLWNLIDRSCVGVVFIPSTDGQESKLEQCGKPTEPNSKRHGWLCDRCYDKQQRGQR